MRNMSKLIILLVVLSVQVGIVASGQVAEQKGLKNIENDANSTIVTASAVPVEEWSKTFEGYFSFVGQTSDGGYIVTGTIGNNGLLIKTDSYGNKLWSKTFGGPNSYNAQSVQQTKDGGYILVGYTNSYGTGGFDAWLIKTDSYGNKLWSKTFGGPNSYNAQSVQQTKDGGYILVGYTNSYGTGGFDAWLIKTDSYGNKLWSKTFGGSNNDDAQSVQQTKDGGYILVGYTNSYGAGNEDVWLIKTDNYGNKLWSKTFGGSDLDKGTYVQQTTDGGYIIAGSTGSFDVGDEDYEDSWLIKTDINGNKLWSKVFDYTDYATSVQQTTDGGYIVATNAEAEYDDPPTVYYWSELIKTDSYGNEQWGKQLNGDDLILGSVRQTKDGGYIAAGSYAYSSRSYLKKLGKDKSITIISPNGGENWIKGTVNKIKWNYLGSWPYVKIELLKGEILNKLINSSTPNDGSYDWAIPSSQLLGSDYKIRITSTSNSLYKDTSDNNFAISSLIPANLLKNPGFETVSGILPQYWSKYQTGTKAIFTYPEIGRVGGKSVAIKYLTKETGNVALWQQSGIVVISSKQYRLSGYMKLSNVTGGGTYPRYNGADLRINWYRSDGGLIKTDLITRSGTSTWTKYEKTFTAPSNAVKASIRGDLFNASGKVWFDDLSFVRIS